MLTASELAQLVFDTRKAQARYFKDRTQSALVESKALEKKLDNEVEKILNKNKSVQTQIF